MKIDLNLCYILFFFCLPFSILGQNHQGNLIGTKWINEIVPDLCYDSIEFKTDSTAVYYSCETDYSYKASYIKNDKKIEILILDNHLTTDFKPTSKWILVLKDSELEYFYIGQKSPDGFREVEQKIYNQVGKFQKIEN